jgi:SPP1 gp7 family putative phage head morphogenesis protein
MAVMNYQSSLEAAGISGDVAIKRAHAYANKLLTQRANAIASTELVEIVNQGQLAAWKQAVDDGILSGNQSGRKWIAEPDACKRCRALHGTVVTLTGTFLGGVDAPPLHTRCRCGMKLIAKKAAIAA